MLTNPAGASDVNPTYSQLSSKRVHGPHWPCTSALMRRNLRTATGTDWLWIIEDQAGITRFLLLFLRKSPGVSLPRVPRTRQSLSLCLFSQRRVHTTGGGRELLLRRGAATDMPPPPPPLFYSGGLAGRGSFHGAQR